MKNQVFAIIGAAKQLGVSAVACIVKGVIGGLVIALILTLCCFWWGDSSFGLKYVVGAIFFIVCGVAISLHRIVSGEVKLLDKAVDSVVEGAAEKAQEGVNFLSANLSPEEQFENAKGFLVSKCPALSSLVGAVNYQQVMSLASKSQKIAQFSSQVSSQVDAAMSLPDAMRTFVSPLKLVWQVPVSLFLRKVVVLVGGGSLVVIAVRALMLYLGM